MTVLHLFLLRDEVPFLSDMVTMEDDAPDYHSQVEASGCCMIRVLSNQVGAWYYRHCELGTWPTSLAFNSD